MANEFFSNLNFVSIIRRTHAVAGLFNTLKVYYYVVPPNSNSYTVCEFDNADRLDRSSIIHIRSYILQLINKLMFNQQNIINGNILEEKDWNRDEEFQHIFNFIASVTEVILIFMFFTVDFYYINKSKKKIF